MASKCPAAKSAFTIDQPDSRTDDSDLCDRPKSGAEIIAGDHHNPAKSSSPPEIESGKGDLATKSDDERGPRCLLHWRVKAFLKKAATSAEKGSKWIWDDMKRPHLRWVKMLFFLQSASLVSFYPYLILHLRHLGLTIQDASLVTSVLPVVDIVGPPLAGLLADKMGNFRLFLALITLLNGASVLLLLPLQPQPGTVRNFACHYQSTISSSEDLQIGNSSHRTFICYEEVPTIDLYREGINGSSDDTSANMSWYEGTIIVGSSDESPSLAGDKDWQILVNCSAPGPELQANPNGTKVYLRNLGEGTERTSATTEDNDGDVSFECSGPIDGTNSSGSLFWIYMSIRLVIDILRSSSLTLFEGAVVAIIKESGGDYGLQKLFSTFGAVAFGPLAGFLIDRYDRSYRVIFYLYFGLRVASSLCMLRIDLGFKRQGRKVVKNVSKVVGKLDVVANLFTFMFCGVLWGLLENYLFWFMENQGASKLLLGTSLTVGTITGFPIMLCSCLIVRKLGHAKLTALSLAVYAVRLFGYSSPLVAERPSLLLTLEVLKPVCTQLLLISTMTYIKDLANPEITSTLEAIFGSSYFGVGMGLGGLLGGQSIKALGFQGTFQLFSGLAFGIMTAYIITLWFIKLSRSKVYVLDQS